VLDHVTEMAVKRPLFARPSVSKLTFQKALCFQVLDAFDDTAFDVAVIVVSNVGAVVINVGVDSKLQGPNDTN